MWRAPVGAGASKTHKNDTTINSQQIKERGRSALLSQLLMHLPPATESIRRAQRALKETIQQSIINNLGAFKTPPRASHFPAQETWWAVHISAPAPQPSHKPPSLHSSQSPLGGSQRRICHHARHTTSHSNCTNPVNPVKKPRTPSHHTNQHVHIQALSFKS